MPNLTFVDCETCSLAGGIIELSVASVKNLSEVRSMTKEAFLELTLTERFKNPIPIEQGAFEIHGIREETLKDLPLYTPADFYKHFVLGDDITPLDALAEVMVLVGHNIATFDRPRLGLLPEHKTIDTLNLARLLEKTKDLTHNLGEFKAGNKLDTLISIYCPETASHQFQHHGSAADCYKTLVFLQWLLENPLKGANEGELVFLSSTANSMPVRKALLNNIKKRQ